MYTELHVHKIMQEKFADTKKGNKNP
jgi:hypothetical protein